MPNPVKHEIYYDPALKPARNDGWVGFDDERVYNGDLRCGFEFCTALNSLSLADNLSVARSYGAVGLCTRVSMAPTQHQNSLGLSMYLNRAQLHSQLPVAHSHGMRCIDIAYLGQLCPFKEKS